MKFLLVGIFYFYKIINKKDRRQLKSLKSEVDHARPPLTSKEAPVIYLDRLEARNEETSAISRGSPKSPRGI